MSKKSGTRGSVRGFIGSAVIIFIVNLIGRLSSLFHVKNIHYSDFSSAEEKVFSQMARDLERDVKEKNGKPR